MCLAESLECYIRKFTTPYKHSYKNKTHFQWSSVAIYGLYSLYADS